MSYPTCSLRRERDQRQQQPSLLPALHSFAPWRASSVMPTAGPAGYFASHDARPSRSRDRRRYQRSEKRLRLRHIPAGTTGGHRDGPRRKRLHRRHADRCGQIAHLPDSCTHPPGHGPGTVSPDQPDEGSAQSGNPRPIAQQS